MRIFLRSVTLRVINQMNHAVSAWSGPQCKIKAQGDGHERLRVGLDRPSGMFSAWPSHGQGHSPGVTRLIWPQCTPLASVLGPWRVLVLPEALQLPKVEPLPYGCCPPQQRWGGCALMRCGHPSPCPPGHQHLRKWVTPTISLFQSFIFSGTTPWRWNSWESYSWAMEKRNHIY